MRLLTVIMCYLLAALSPVLAQEPIQITASDLPGEGDTYRMSIATNPQSIDIEKAGPDQTWDYQNLNAATQYIDTFRSLGSLPQVYGLLSFQKDVNYGKEEAALLDNLPMADQLPLSNLYGFYSKSSNAYEQVAFGVALGGQNIPVPFRDNDRIYKLPLSYQQQDSSEAFVSFPPQNLPLPIPDSTLYFEEARKRINTVDAWGTLKTPYGSFEALRVKTVIEREDSVSLQGIAQAVTPPDQVVFKWLAKDGGNPILQVQAQRIAGELVVSSAAYQDSARDLTETGPTGLPDPREAKLKLYPNPATSTLNVSYAGDEAERYTLYTLNGRLKQQGSLSSGGTNGELLKVDNLAPGLYLFQLTNSKGKAIRTQKLLVR